MSRQTPANLQDLLKLSISHQTDGAMACDGIEIEKKTFLENVINSMSSANGNEEFLRAIKILKNNLSNENEKCDALTSIRENIDNIDLANRFVKIDGADIIIKCIMYDNTHIQINAINIVAELSQNNPFCQKYFVDNGTIKLLVLQLSKKDDKITASALYALSALIRHFEPALAELKEIDGLKSILICLDSKCSRVFTKTCVLISSISSEFPIARDEFIIMDGFENLSKNLEMVNDFDIKTEVLLIAMAELIKSPKCDPNAILRRNTAEILKKILDQNENLPQCEEIVTHSKIILDHLEGTMK